MDDRVRHLKGFMVWSSYDRSKARDVQSQKHWVCRHIQNILTGTDLECTEAVQFHPCISVIVYTAFLPTIHRVSLCWSFFRTCDTCVSITEGHKSFIVENAWHVLNRRKRPSPCSHFLLPSHSLGELWRFPFFTASIFKDPSLSFQ